MEHTKLATKVAEKLIDDPMGGPVTSIDGVLPFIQRVETIIAEAAGVIAVAMIVWGATLFLTAGGNEERLKKGKDVLKWAVIGLIVIITSHALVVMLIKILGGSVS